MFRIMDFNPLYIGTYIIKMEIKKNLSFKPKNIGCNIHGIW
jgi:hypothetical protein